MKSEPIEHPPVLPPPRSPWWPLFVVGVFVVAGLLLVRWAALTPMRPQSGGAAVASNPAGEAWIVGQEIDGALGSSKMDNGANNWASLVELARDAGARGPQEVQRFVAVVFATLDERSPVDRLAVLGNFFEAKVDVDWSLPLVPTQDGRVSSWPTLRVALFDYLSMRDRQAATLLASEWLSVRPGQPAEWAVALRERLRGFEGGSVPPDVAACLDALLTDEEWLANSPRGWREALDAVAACRAVGFLPKVTALAARQRPREVQQAAHEVLRSLMFTAPAAVLEALNLNTSLLAESSGLRAAMFARADVRVPEQLRALEVYLGRGDVMPGERAQFAAQFPRHDASAAPRLISQVNLQTPEDMVAQDTATRQQIDRWLADAHFKAWHEALRGIHSRLERGVAISR